MKWCWVRLLSEKAILLGRGGNREEVCLKRRESYENIM